MVDEGKELRTTFKGEAAEQIRFLAQKYDLPNSQVSRMAMESALHPDLGRLEDRLEALRQERLREEAAKREPKPVADSAPVAEAAAGAVENDRVLQALSDLSGRLDAVAGQLAAMARKEAAKPGLGGVDDPDTGSTRLSDADFLDPASEIRDDFASTAMPDHSATDQPGADRSSPDQAGMLTELLGAVQAVQRHLDTMSVDSTLENLLRQMAGRLDELAGQVVDRAGDGEGAAASASALSGMQITLREILDRLNTAPAMPENPGAGITGADLQSALESAMQGMRNSLNNLVDVAGGKLPEMVAQATVDRLGESLREELERVLDGRLSRMESSLSSLARQGAVSASPVVDLSSIEDRLGRLSGNIQALFAELQRLARPEQDSADSQAAALEAKVDGLFEMVEGLVEESARPFSLQPSKGFGKAFLGKLRVVKEG